MTGYELWTSGIGSDRFTNWATTTVPQNIEFLFTQCLVETLFSVFPITIKSSSLLISSPFIWIYLPRYSFAITSFLLLISYCPFDNLSPEYFLILYIVSLYLSSTLCVGRRICIIYNVCPYLLFVSQSFFYIVCR